MKIKQFLILGFCLSATQIQAKEKTKAKALEESSSSSTSDDSEIGVPMTGVSTTIEKKPKPKTRIQGNFKGKDPMIAPDGEIKPKPTDGSRPAGNK